jgi:hypothetical protein
VIEPLHPVPEAATLLHSPSQLLALIRQGRLRALMAKAGTA